MSTLIKKILDRYFKCEIVGEYYDQIYDERMGRYVAVKKYNKRYHLRRR